MVNCLLSLLEGESPLYGWRAILDQIKTPYTSNTNRDTANIYITTNLTSSLLDKVKEGAAVIVEKPKDLSCLGIKKQGSAFITKVYIPEYKLDSIALPMMIDIYEYESVRGYALLNENRITKEGIINGKLPFILPIYHGKGAIFAISGQISNLLFAHGNDLRKFSRHTNVSERVSSIDKSLVSEVMINVLKEAHRFLHLPMFTLSYYPQNKKTLFMVRIDVDGVFDDNTQCIAETCDEYGVNATFYVNKSMCEKDANRIQNITSHHIIANHGDIHNVFDTYMDNYRNIKNCEIWADKEFSNYEKLFVAPRGMYHENLGRALLDCGYTSSSDFGYMFDGFPHFVLLDGSPSNLLQIPCNPFCIGRSEIYAKENGIEMNDDDVITFYQSMIEEKILKHEPILIYGHPHGLGKRVHVLKEVLKILHNKQIDSITMRDFESLWRERHKTTMEVVYNAIKDEYEVTLDNRLFHVETTKDCKYTVNYLNNLKEDL